MKAAGGLPGARFGGLPGFRFSLTCECEFDDGGGTGSDGEAIWGDLAGEPGEKACSCWLLPETSNTLTSMSSFETADSFAILNDGLLIVAVGVGGGGALASGNLP